MANFRLTFDMQAARLALQSIMKTRVMVIIGMCQ